MRYLEFLFEENLPIIDKHLAMSVMDAASRLGFGTTYLVPVDDVLHAMHQEWDAHIKPAIDGDKLNVYRAIAVGSSYSIRRDSLGIYWSTVPTTAQPYWGKSQFWLILHAVVDLQYVNWDDTFALHLEGGEHEVRLYSGTPVQIVGVKWKSDNPGHDLDDDFGDHLIGQTLTT